MDELICVSTEIVILSIIISGEASFMMAWLPASHDDNVACLSLTVLLLPLLPPPCCQLEEQHGLARHAMEVYERGARAVPKKERLTIYDIYVSRAAEFFGIGKVRHRAWGLFLPSSLSPDLT